MFKFSNMAKTHESKTGVRIALSLLVSEINEFLVFGENFTIFWDRNKLKIICRSIFSLLEPYFFNWSVLRNRLGCFVVI